jgi:hypothetical protein
VTYKSLHPFMLGRSYGNALNMRTWMLAAVMLWMFVCFCYVVWAHGLGKEEVVVCMMDDGRSSRVFVVVWYSQK